jgi:hypothetical protein
MYFFNYIETPTIMIAWLLLRMIGCLIIGQKILCADIDGKEIKIYFHRPEG